MDRCIQRHYKGSTEEKKQIVHLRWKVKVLIKSKYKKLGLTIEASLKWSLINKTPKERKGKRIQCSPKWRSVLKENAAYYFNYL